MNGFSDVIGSWKIIAIRLPRIARISSVGQRQQVVAVEDRPRRATMRPGGVGMSRMIDRFVTDLPEPDSPTMPSVSPRRQVEAHAVDRPHDAPSSSK